MCYSVKQRLQATRGPCASAPVLAGGFKALVTQVAQVTEASGECVLQRGMQGGKSVGFMAEPVHIMVEGRGVVQIDPFLIIECGRKFATLALRPALVAPGHDEQGGDSLGIAGTGGVLQGEIQHLGGLGQDGMAVQAFRYAKRGKAAREVGIVFADKGQEKLAKHAFLRHFRRMYQRAGNQADAGVKKGVILDEVAGEEVFIQRALAKFVKKTVPDDLLPIVLGERMQLFAERKFVETLAMVLESHGIVLSTNTCAVLPRLYFFCDIFAQGRPLLLSAMWHEQSHFFLPAGMLCLPAISHPELP